MANRFLRSLASASLLGLVACHETTQYQPPPLDRFFFPTGMVLRHVDPNGNPCGGGFGGVPGCQTQLFVASADADLSYDPATGGTVLGVDVGATVALTNAGSPIGSPVWLGSGAGGLRGVRIGSYAGELAVLDAESCPTFQQGQQAQLLVTSRAQNELYRVDITSPNGEISCGHGAGGTCDSAHTVAVSNFGNTSSLTAGDSYGVSVVCADLPDPLLGSSPGPQQLAFLTYLRVANGEGGLGILDLLNAPLGPPSWEDLGVSIAESTVFDPISTRLFVTEMFGAVAVAPLRWLTLATPSVGYLAVNMENYVRGAEVRGVALSTDRTRLYLALRIYDPVAASQIGARPTTDTAGALVVVDASAAALDPSELRILNVVPLERGSSQVKIVPRPVSAGLRDLVAVLSEEDESLVLYDDETGAIANVYGVCQSPPNLDGTPGPGDKNAPPPCDLGKPLLGQQPSTLLVEPISPAAPEANGAQLARLYVASFDRSWVNVILLDPLAPSSDPLSWVRIGLERAQVQISNPPDPL